MKIFLGFLVFLSVACRPSYKVGELVGVDENAKLENTTWALVELNGVAVKERVTIQLNSATKSVEGFGGCNQFTGTYDKEGKKVSFVLASTKKACPTNMELETSFFTAMGSVDHYEQVERSLKVLSGGKVVATFTVYTHKSI